MENDDTKKRYRKKYDKHDRSKKVCADCGFEKIAEDFRIYYYKPKDSNYKEKRRVANCNACVGLKRRLKMSKKRLIEGEKISEENKSRISDWIDEQVVSELD